MNRSLMYPLMNDPGVSIYPGAPTGIDFRVELDTILNEYGHWVMVRHYDTTTRSEYWDEASGEAVGGPPWEWTDYIVRSRKVIMRTGGVLAALEMPTVPGMLTIPYSTYYLKWDVITNDVVTMNDEIYEFPWSSNRTPGADEVIELCNEKYNILEAIDLLGDAGRREYYLCVCKADVIGW